MFRKDALATNSQKSRTWVTIIIGDLITTGLCRNSDVWETFCEESLNLGICGDCIQHILWRLKCWPLPSQLKYTAQKMNFLLRISSVNVITSAGNCGLVTFTEEILNGKLHFLCSAMIIQGYNIRSVPSRYLTTNSSQVSWKWNHQCLNSCSK